MLKFHFASLEKVVNPLSGYYMADYYFGNEPLILKMPSKRIGKQLNASNAHRVTPESIVFCQVNFFDAAIPQSNTSEFVLRHPRVLHWFSQNPIYSAKPKYSPFPYGIFPFATKPFLSYRARLSRDFNWFRKKAGVFHGGLRVESNVMRQKMQSHFNISFERRPFHEYIKKIGRAAFVLSLQGDRPDCYRHWEAIGVGTLPITDLPQHLYRPLFGNSVVYTDASSAIRMLQEGISPNYRRVSLERDLKSISFSMSLLDPAVWKARLLQKTKRNMSSSISFSDAR